MNPALPPGFGHGPSELPPPPPEAAAVSARLTRLIRDRITEAGGAIPFAEYMELALYAPGLGYYSAGASKFGPEGDYVTAPETSDLFGRCVAVQCAEVLQALGGGVVLELGAGTGRMAADVLVELDRLGTLPGTYGILDLSGSLRARQQETLSALPGELRGRLQWLDRLPEEPMRGIVLGNEVLDAMPVCRFRTGEHDPEEYAVGWDGDRFVWRRGPPVTPGLESGVAGLVAEQGLPPGYSSELNPWLGGWLNSVSRALDAGLVLLLDYGFPRREYYHPERVMGTLACHYRHRAHDDPFFFPGLQDITAHVDFTAVAEAASAAGFRVAGYTTQAAFLMGTGIGEELSRAESDDPVALARLSAALNRLLSPAEMGELFKAMALVKGVDMPLRGFVVQDRRGRL